MLLAETTSGLSLKFQVASVCISRRGINCTARKFFWFYFAFVSYESS